MAGKKAKKTKKLKKAKKVEKTLNLEVTPLIR
jgi:hypothetical protein